MAVFQHPSQPLLLVISHLSNPSHGYLGSGGNECLLLFERGDEGDSADGFQVDLLLLSFNEVDQFLDQIVLGLFKQFHQLPLGLGKRHAVVPEEGEDRAEVLAAPVYQYPA